MELPKEINDLIEQHKPPPEKQAPRMTGNQLAEWRKKRFARVSGYRFETIEFDGHKYIVCKERRND